MMSPQERLSEVVDSLPESLCGGIGFDQQTDKLTGRCVFTKGHSGECSWHRPKTRTKKKRSRT